MKDSEVTRPKGRWFQFSLRALLLFVLGCAILFAWISAEFHRSERRYEAYRQIEMDIYTTDLGEFPWYSGWLHKMFGHEECYDPTFLILNNFASVDDDTLATVAQFQSLEQLWLNGDISITDAGLEHLKRLTRLRELSLGDAPVSEDAVARLRQALPACEVFWTPPTEEQQQYPRDE